MDGMKRSLSNKNDNPDLIIWQVPYVINIYFDYNARMLRKFLLILLVILLIALAWFGITTLNRSISNAINPLQQANNAMGTQISELLHPTPKVIPDPVTIINEVRSLARLETIQYSIEKVITAETNQGFWEPLVGDRLLFVGHGIVIAGIDLEKLQPEDMWLENGALYVRLPQAEIFIITLDNDKSYVYDRETGLLTKGDQNLETTARQAAEEEIEKAALDDGILTLAQVNAENYLTRFFQALGYQVVLFENSTP